MTSPYLERPKRKLEDVLLRKQRHADGHPSLSVSDDRSKGLLTGGFIVLPCLILMAVGVWVLMGGSLSGEPEITGDDMDRILEVAPAAGPPINAE